MARVNARLRLLGGGSVTWLGLLWLGGGVAAAEPPSGRAWEPRKRPIPLRAVLLLHDQGRTHEAWGQLGPRLAANGFLVLAPDLVDLQADTVAAADWLTERDPVELHVVGAGIGANLALRLGADRPAVTDVVLLSPEARAPHLALSEAIASYDRPILIVAAKGDPLSARAATFVRQRAGGEVAVHLHEGSAHGTHLLSTSVTLEPLITEWLGRAVREPPTSRGRPASVRTGDVGELTTEGVRLDERKR